MPRLLSRSTPGDALVLGVAVAPQVLHGVLVERTAAGPRFLRSFTQPLGGAPVAVAFSVNADSGGEAPVIQIGETRPAATDLFLASEFGALTNSAPLGASAARTLSAHDLFSGALQAMLAEITDVYGAAPSLAFVLPPDDVAYAEVRVAEVPSESPAARRARMVAALAETVPDADAGRVVFVPEAAMPGAVEAESVRALALVPRTPDRVTASLEDLRDRLRTPAAARLLDTEASLYIGLARLIPDAPPSGDGAAHPAAAPSPYAPPLDLPDLAPPSFDAPPFDAPGFGTLSFDVPLPGAPVDRPGDDDLFDGLPELPPLTPDGLAAPDRSPEGDGAAFDPFAGPPPAFDAPAFAPPASDASPFDLPPFDAPAFEAPPFDLPAFAAPAFEAERSGDTGPVDDGVTLVLRIGATDTLALFLSGGEPLHVAHLSSLTAADPPETLCSRVLLVQDEHGLGDVTRLLLMSERDEDDLLGVFGLFFPDATVSSLRGTLPGTLGEAAREASEGGVTAALAAALRLAGTPAQQAAFPDVTLLPRALARRRASRGVNWTVFALYALLFVTALGLTARYLYLDAEIDAARDRLRASDAVTADASVARLQTRLDSLGQVQAQRERALLVLDSLLTGSDRWSRTLETVARGAESVRGMWIESWAYSGQTVTLTGTATSRDRIVEIAEVTGGDLLSMTFNEIRDFPVYTFTLALALPNDLPEAARYLREAAAAQARTASGPPSLATAVPVPAPAPATPAPSAAATPPAPSAARVGPALAAALPR